MTDGVYMRLFIVTIIMILSRVEKAGAYFVRNGALWCKKSVTPVVGSALQGFTTCRSRRAMTLAAATSHHHQVGGISASEVAIYFKSERLPSQSDGRVIILEANAESQESLVEQALNSAEKGAPVEDPYGAVLWPSAKLVANTILSKYRREELEAMTVVELGTGTGLVSIITALAGCKNVMATDFNPLPLSLLQRAAELNGVGAGIIKTQLFDVKAMEEQRMPQCDLLLVADMLYEPATAVAVAHRVAEAVQTHGARVIVGDSPNRPGRPHFLATLKELLKREDVEFASVKGESVIGVRHELISDKRSVDPVKSKELEMGLLEI